MNLWPSKLEREVVKAIAAHEPLAGEALTDQLLSARVTSREKDGSGFHTRFETSSALRLARPDGQLGPIIDADVEGAPLGMGFLASIKDGRLEALEGFSYGDDISPLDLENVRFSNLVARPKSKPGILAPTAALVGGAILVLVLLLTLPLLRGAP